MSPHTLLRIQQIRDDHRPRTVKVGRWWWQRRRVCSLCSRLVPCPAVQWATEVGAGRRDPGWVPS